jgi:quinol monooxygenase YgiN
MSISLIVAGLGTVVAGLGSGLLLDRCFRAPRGDIIAWSIALLGLLVSLGSQTLGHATGFDPAMFRAMEIGGQLIAPLALVLALSEVAAKSMAARFCARLYIPALAIVALVVLALDQLADQPFSKAWPDPAVYYQALPGYVLMFAIGPITALIAIIAVLVVVFRSGQPGWNAVLPAQLMGGAAALALAYPELAQLVGYLTGLHLPVSSLFAALCTIAAILTWLAGTRTARVRLAALHGGDGDRSRWRDAEDFHGVDQPRAYEPFEPGGEQGVYRGGGLYRPESFNQNSPESYPHDLTDSGADWHDDRAGGYADDWRRGDADSDYADGWRGHDAAGGGQYRDDYDTGDFATGDQDLDYQAGGWHSADGIDEEPVQFEPPDQRDYDGRQAGWHDDHGRPDGVPAAPRLGGEDAVRAQLFGQIAIYTLLEDRVDDFDELAERVVQQVRSREPDTLVFIVHAVPSAPMQRILYEVYRDRAAYQWHNQQPHVTHFEADRRPCVLATNVIELGLQQAKVSPFPSVTELFGEPGYDTSGFERPDYLRDYGRTKAPPGGSRDGW